MVRDLDLKKPPSIAESIDWARALLLLGAQDIDTRDLHRHDVDHRQAPHGPRRRRRARRREARRPCGLADRASRRAATARAARAPRAWPARLLEFGEELRGEGVAIGTSELLDAFAALRARAVDRAGRLPRGAGRDAGQVPGRPPRLRARLRPLLLPRRRAGRPSRRACARSGGIDADEAGALDMEELRRQVAAGGARRRRGRDARPRAAGDRRVRPPGRGLGRHRRRRPAHPPRARRCAPSRSPTCRRRTRAATACPATRSARFEAMLRQELERGADRAHRGSCRRRGRSTSSTARCRPGRCRTSPPCTASSRSSSGG